MINKFYLLYVIFSGSPDLTLKTCLVHPYKAHLDRKELGGKGVFWIQWLKRGTIFGFHKRLPIPSLLRKLTPLRSSEQHYIFYTHHSEISSRVPCAATKHTLSFKRDMLWSSRGVHRYTRNIRVMSKLWMPEGWHKASSVPGNKSFKRHGTKLICASCICAHLFL